MWMLADVSKVYRDITYPWLNCVREHLELWNKELKHMGFEI